MKKTKEQKAITLIALIITIVVLLILAAVAIASITNDGVLSYAENAATQYNQAVKNEQDTLEGYIDYLNKHNGGTGSGNGESSGDEGEGEGTGSETIGTVTVGTIVTENSTINGEEYSSTNPIIPAGFKAINTDTAKWNEGILADNVKNGLVISDEAGNEFVWIPVENINDMAKVKSGVDVNGRTNYKGMLYYFTSTSATEIISSSYNEPANLTGYDGSNDYRDKADRFTTIAWTENLYQESFNKMVESVSKYNGFYVGRYEMSFDENGKAQSKAGVESLYGVNWWNLYEKALTYSSSGVVSEMIWGCQYDAMIRWMQGNNIDIESSTPIDTARATTASENKTRVTGSVDSNDILNNVYDILGNSFEWTQESQDSSYRSIRGGGEDCLCTHGNCYPTINHTAASTRITLYVE